jgi:hypothetical protein
LRCALTSFDLGLGIDRLTVRIVVRDHTQSNELLQQIFDFTATAKGQKPQYSKLEKRLFLSANSAAAKDQTLAMRRSRQNFGRESKTRLFAHGDEEDD